MTHLLRRLLRRVKRLVRPARPPEPVKPVSQRDPSFATRKQAKLRRLEPLLSQPITPGPLFYDYLTPELREQFNIVDTDLVSAHDYDSHAMKFIQQYPDGLILDCGCGLRNTYYDNVVNFEIVPYETTDVRGVGEQLPFRDGVFDVVFSFNVLEHVRDPFGCARELTRVLKPGGRLYAVVPFLQPFHAYPHHYYNMTAQGLANLFADQLELESQEVNLGGMPIFMLTWVLRRWSESLSGSARRQFLNLRVGDLIGDPLEHVNERYVRELPTEAQFELAATTSLFARKIG